MHRFFSSAPLPAQPVGSVALDRDEAHHARKVLRIAVGETVGLLDGRGGVGEGVIDAYSGGEAVVRLTSVTHRPPATPRIVVATAIPKGSRAQDMVDQLSQVGVSRVVPLLTQRSVVDPGEGKLERFERTVMESAKQCGRAWAMEVGKPTDLAGALRGDETVKLIAAPGGKVMDPESRSKQLASAKAVLILVGPEGGWTAGELDQASAAGAEPWSLGPHVMRIETAAVAAGAIAACLARRA